MLHRPYIRVAVRAEVERCAERNERGQFLDANTHRPIMGPYDLGHKSGYEHAYMAAKAESLGLNQKQFNEIMNNPDLYQIECPHENRSHQHEMHKENQEMQAKSFHQKGEKPMEKNAFRNAFIDRIKADKATIERCNTISREAAKHSNAPASHSKADSGGHERGDGGAMSHGREATYKSASPRTPAFHNIAEGHNTGESSSGHSATGHSAGMSGHSGAQTSGGHAAGHGGQ